MATAKVSTRCGVGLRRMRAALSLFKELIQDAQSEEIKTDPISGAGVVIPRLNHKFPPLAPPSAWKSAQVTIIRFYFVIYAQRLPDKHGRSELERS
jgi:hypothetical protein